MNANNESSRTFTLRDAIASDLAAINDIYNHYVRTCTCTYQEQPEPLADRQAWFQVHGNAYPVIVAESAGQIVAWASLSPFGSARSRQAYRFTVEDSIYVRQDMHRRGIGSALLSDLIRRASSLGYRSIVAFVSADQVPSITLHEKFGFIKVAHLHQVGIKFDKWLDLVCLQKTL